MKRLLATILCLFVVIAGIFPVLSAGAAENLVISATNASGAVGDEVAVTLNIDSNPGYAALLLTIPKHEGFELIEAVSGSGMGVFTREINLLWDSANNITKTGTLVTLTFRITDKAVLGENNIEVIILECNNEDRNKVTVVCSDITVNVTGAPETNAPETSAPETGAPETSAPETSAPETSAPETNVPETSAPETNAQETSAPETSAPETNAPETSAPETGAPETSAPETSAPDVLSIVASSVIANRGGVATVTLSINNNPGYSVLVMTVLEKEGFELLSVSAEDGFGVFTEGKNFVWDSGSNITKTGTLITLLYKVSEDAKVGENEIELKIRECIGKTGNACKYSSENIVITVKDGAEENEDHENNGEAPVSTETSEESTGLNELGCGGCKGSLSLSALLVSVLAATVFIFKKKSN